MKWLTPLKMGVLALGLTLTLTTSTAVAQEENEYRFVMVSHIGSNDPNMKWLTIAMEEFEDKYPNVSLDYVSSNQYSVQELVRLLDQTIASRPDGIAVPIVSRDALEGPIRRAIDQGIPVVAFNIPDSRPKEERIPYMTYVGGDEYLTGYMTGQYAIEKAEAGEVPMPEHVVCAMIAAEHEGLRERCRGIEEAVAEVGATTEYLFTGSDPATFRGNLQSYLAANPQSNYILNMGDFTAPWSWQVANDLDMNPDVNQEGMTILAVGIGPIGLSGLKNNHLLVASEQGFWLQGYIPFEWLYWHHELGYEPQSDIITGPIMVDRDNIDKFDPLSKAVFGAGSEDDSAWQ